MLTAGVARNRLAGVLGTAFAGGLLSQDTLSYRLSVLFGGRLVDPGGLVGDLSLRTRRRRRWSPAAGGAFEAWRRMILGASDTDSTPLLLALDWATAHEDDLLVGRSAECDVQLADDSVSRRHARLVFRDGTWVIQDRGSTNGTIVNGDRVGRCQLQPGDRLWLGEQTLDID
jgi:hypothetical protein